MITIIGSSPSKGARDVEALLPRKASTCYLWLRRLSKGDGFGGCDVFAQGNLVAYGTALMSSC
jgi:hypothetical protein